MPNPRILVSCPPMLGMIDEFDAAFSAVGLEYTAADVEQVLDERTLMEMLPDYDGWIMGDDPASFQVVEAGSKGKFRAAIKWGVGVDNVNFEAFDAFGIPVDNTPNVFGGEVADVALTYLLGLARETYRIDREIRASKTWPKPAGISVAGRSVGVVGFGDIGSQTAKRVIACGGKVIVYDPAFHPVEGIEVENASWPSRLSELDFLVFTCPLNEKTHHMFNRAVLDLIKPGIRIVNVARGPVISQAALVEGLENGVVHSAALDVFEIEPMQSDNPLRRFDQCIFGSHNGSNSKDAVRRVSLLAIEKINRMLTE
ncbi:MAG: hypothetical protein NXH72_04195 [Hyphomonadaceae bacterium]|nr:hypothetical protein [Hyphomonadaceae bacterium]